MFPRIKPLHPIILDPAGPCSRAFRATRRALPALKLAVAVCGAASCVPQLRYEEARSSAEVEGEARRRAALELKRAKAEVERLQAELGAREEKLRASDGTLHEVKFEQERISKQRDESASLVEQLRGELSRVGSHLQASVEEKSRLQDQLSQTSGEGNAVVVLRVHADVVFEPESDTLQPRLAPLLGALALSGLRSRWSGTLREVDVDSALTPELGEKRRSTLRAWVAQNALETSLAYEGGAPGTPRLYELLLVPSEPGGR